MAVSLISPPDTSAPSTAAGANRRPVCAPGPSADHPTHDRDATWFDATPHAVRLARVAVVDQLRAWGVDGDATDDAALLVSELVGNVVAHTASRSVGLALSATPDRVAVSVREQRARDVERPGELIPDDVAVMAPTTAIHGRGMKLLDALAAEWGVSRAQRTTSTWFTVAPARRLPLAAVDPVSAHLADRLRRALRRAELLLDITRALADVAGERAVSDVMTRHLRQYLDACFVGVAVVDGDGSLLHYVSLDPLPAATEQRWSVVPHDGLSPVSAAALHRTEYVHLDAASADAGFPGIAAHMSTAGVASMVHLPMLAGSDAVGTLAVCWDAPLDLDDDDLDLLTTVAGYAAQALQRGTNDAGGDR